MSWTSTLQLACFIVLQQPVHHGVVGTRKFSAISLLAQPFTTQVSESWWCLITVFEMHIDKNKELDTSIICFKSRWISLSCVTCLWYVRHIVNLGKPGCNLMFEMPVPLSMPIQDAFHHTDSVPSTNYLLASRQGLFFTRTKSTT